MIAEVLMKWAAVAAIIFLMGAGFFITSGSINRDSGQKSVGLTFLGVCALFAFISCIAAIFS